MRAWIPTDDARSYDANCILNYDKIFLKNTSGLQLRTDNRRWGQQSLKKNAK